MLAVEDILERQRAIEEILENPQTFSNLKSVFTAEFIFEYFPHNQSFPTSSFILIHTNLRTYIYTLSHSLSLRQVLKSAPDLERAIVSIFLKKCTTLDFYKILLSFREILDVLPTSKIGKNTDILIENIRKYL